MPFPRSPLPDRRAPAARRPSADDGRPPALPPRRLIHGGEPPARRPLRPWLLWTVGVLALLAAGWWAGQTWLPAPMRPSAWGPGLYGWMAGRAAAPGGETPGGSLPADGGAVDGGAVKDGRSQAPADPARWDPPAEEVATIVLAGDMMLGRTVGAAIGRSEDLLFPFTAVAPWLEKADLTVGVLESPLVHLVAGTPPPADGTPPAGQPAGAGSPAPDPALAAPPAAALVLASAGFDALSLANDHAVDMGPAGLAETLSHLGAAGIIGFGAGPDMAAAAQPAVFEVRGSRVALIGVNELGDSLRAATPAGPGVLWSEAAGLRRAMAAARAQADVVIAVVHWGSPLSTRHGARQADVARLLVESGADLVVGSGPNVRQGAEFIRGRPVFYSLGNLVYDQMQEPEAAAEGWVLRVQVHQGKLLQVQVLPVRLGTDGAPRAAPGIWSGRRWLELSQGGVLLLQGAPEANQGDLVLFRRLPEAPACPSGVYRTGIGRADAIALEREGYRGSRYWLTRPGDPAGCAFLPPPLLSQWSTELPPDTLVRVPAAD